jgi:ribosomal protein S19E (S16A)
MESMVRSIKTLTEPLQQDTPGMHALVWVYFIAAASTQTPENQSYFAEKLRQVHRKTHMHNIIVAVERLEEMWQQEYGGWTARFPMMRPVLAI